MTRNAKATNAIIVKDEGLHVTYHKKCPYCGAVSSSTFDIAMQIGGVNNSSATCQSCGKNFNVRFER